MSGNELVEWRMLLTEDHVVPELAAGGGGLDPDELYLAVSKMFPGKS